MMSGLGSEEGRGAGMGVMSFAGDVMDIMVAQVAT